MTHKYGLVLAGGGGKGAYQIGALTALEKIGFTLDKFHALAGSSIGALNAALYMQNDLDIAHQAWLAIKPEQVFKIEPQTLLTTYLEKLPVISTIRNKLWKWSLLLAANGLFSQSGIITLINNYLDLQAVSNTPTPSVTITCTELPRFKANYVSLYNMDPDKIKQILLASAAIPLVFRPVELEGKHFIDGGVVDNVPIKPVYDAGCDRILVVHLSRGVIIDHAKYPGAQIWQVVPSQDLGSFFQGTLDFSTQGVQARLELGYQDALRIMRPAVNIASIQSQALHQIERIRRSC